MLSRIYFIGSYFTKSLRVVFNKLPTPFNKSSLKDSVKLGAVTSSGSTGYIKGLMSILIFFNSSNSLALLFL